MKKNNVATIDHVKLQQIKSDNKTMSRTKLAKKYGISYAAAKNAVEARNLKDFKARMANYNKVEAAAAISRRNAKKQNTKAQVKAGAKVVENAQDVYTPQQAKVLIDSLRKHAANLEDRVQTISSLLVESDDNVVSRLYRLENKRGIVRRFLERF